jgi:flagellar biosynthesis/type III secretory pathway chaperone
MNIDMSFSKESALLRANMMAKLQEYSELTQFLSLKLGASDQVLANHMRAITLLLDYEKIQSIANEYRFTKDSLQKCRNINYANNKKCVDIANE